MTLPPPNSVASRAAAGISWTGGTDRTTRCVACGFSGPHRGFATCSLPPFNGAAFVRCPQCDTVHLLDSVLPYAESDQEIDGYVLAGAGLATLVERVMCFDGGSVKRFLDVGCGYGFAMDFAATVLGWDVTGSDPSRAAEVGGRELGLCVVDPTTSNQTALAERGPFDAVLASEVIEHVTDPRGLLESIRSVMAPGAMLVLTTPNAGCLHEATSRSTVVAAISPGLHAFLLSANGLEGLLRTAGFNDVVVETEGVGTLVAYAWNGSRRVGRTPGSAATAASSESLLRTYCEQRLRRGGLPLRTHVALETRRYRSFVAAGELVSANALRVDLVKRVFDLTGVQLDRSAVAGNTAHRSSLLTQIYPAAGVSAIPDHTCALVGVLAYSIGMAELLAEEPEMAERYFAVTELISHQVRPEDFPELADLAPHVAYHRGLAATRWQPHAAGAWFELVQQNSWNRPLIEVDSRLARLFVELVARGHFEAASPWVDTVGRTAAELALSGSTHRVDGLDALLSLGMLALNTQDPWAGLRWFGRCADLAASGSGSNHDISVYDVAVAHRSMAGQRIGRVATELEVACRIECTWRDDHGVFMAGWATYGRHAIRRIGFRTDSGLTWSEPIARPDLLAVYPDLIDVRASGFEVYVDSTAEHVCVVIESEPADRADPASNASTGFVDVLHTEQRIAIPARRTNRRVSEQRHERSAAAGDTAETAESLDFGIMQREFVRHLPNGPVLAIGVRATSDCSFARQTNALEGREVVCLDIHPGRGVDVVGDIHALDQLFAPGSFAGVISIAVFEHLAMPWLAAQQVAMVLMDGGLAAHCVPWVFPSHSLPNDFWRMSEGGLRILFGPSLGFEPIASGVLDDARVIPEPDVRSPENYRMPTTTSPTGAWVVSRKFSDAADHVVWPVDRRVLRTLAEEYPHDGLL